MTLEQAMRILDIQYHDLMGYARDLILQSHPARGRPGYRNRADQTERADRQGGVRP